jgi:hypothetical protein
MIREDKREGRERELRPLAKAQVETNKKYNAQCDTFTKMKATEKKLHAKKETLFCFGGTSQLVRRPIGSYCV